MYPCETIVPLEEVIFFSALMTIGVLIVFFTARSIIISTFNKIKNHFKSNESTIIFPKQ